MPGRKLLFAFCLLCFSLPLRAQTDTLRKANSNSIFDKITQSVSQFKPDTTAPPQDKITKKIQELRALRGGFNIGKAIEFKLEEDRRKGEMPAAQMDALTHFFTDGNGKQKLDHAITHIYRNLFTYKELKQLVSFYKKSAGQKLATEFPLIMLQSLAAAEMLKTEFMKGVNPN
mgnify:FL=1